MGDVFLRLEVEVKVKADEAFFELVRKNSVFSEKKTHRDTYYNHPCRDFSETDEALRLRDDGEKIVLTYKGPKLDDELKARGEKESVVDGNAYGVLEALGFRRVLDVVKRREFRRSGKIRICLDDVDGLGLYAEFELISEDVEKAKKVLFDYLSKLGRGKGDSVTESYLELLLAAKKSSMA